MPRSLARSVITSWYCMFILWLLVVHLLMDKYLHCMCHSFFSSFYCAEAKSGAGLGVWATSPSELRGTTRPWQMSSHQCFTLLRKQKIHLNVLPTYGAHLWGCPEGKSFFRKWIAIAKQFDCFIFINLRRANAFPHSLMPFSSNKRTFQYFNYLFFVCF